MHIRYSSFLPVLLSLTLAACAGFPVGEPSAPDRGMIVGHIEMPGTLRAVYLHEVGKAFVGGFNRPRAHIQRDGNFMFLDLKPGRYYLAGFDDGQAPYWIPHDEASIRQAIIELRPGGIAFAGSYRVSNIVAPRMGSGSFDLQRLVQPNERAVLRTLRDLTEGTGWAARMDARLGS